MLPVICLLQEEAACSGNDLAMALMLSNHTAMQVRRRKSA